MFEAAVMLLVGLVGGAASAMGTLPSVLVALFGDSSALQTAPTGGIIGGPNLLTPLAAAQGQTFQAGGQNYQINMGKDGTMSIQPAGGADQGTQPTKPTQSATPKPKKKTTPAPKVTKPPGDKSQLPGGGIA